MSFGELNFELQKDLANGLERNSQIGVLYEQKKECVGDAAANGRGE